MEILIEYLNDHGRSLSKINYLVAYANIFAMRKINTTYVVGQNIRYYFMRCEKILVSRDPLKGMIFGG
jgi:hypothetical protein